MSDFVGRENAFFHGEMGEKLEALTTSMLIAMPDFHQHLFNEACVSIPTS